MSKKQVWVSPDSNGGWRVHKPWDKRDIAHIENKDQALKRAIEIAKNQEAELRVQKKDGKIHIANSYWRDPFPPAG